MSPLARGLRDGLQVVDELRGIIPARAGFTSSSPARSRTHGDHPRSRGVYMLPSTLSRVWCGSSPLAFRKRVTMSRDHPRSRGVYLLVASEASIACGSSPLARGLRPGHPGREVLGRIIPARAGFTGSPTCRGGRCRDHPRSRGVYHQPPEDRRGWRGSSPLARGLPPGEPAGHRDPRIIPARAGFTADPRGIRSPAKDHPRSRGVYPPTPWGPSSRTGSSPLARGLPHDHLHAGHDVRIIPARAGFTTWRCIGSWLRTDHPRSRGVYAEQPVNYARILGSSPLARGLHLRILGIPTTSHTTRPRSPSLPT